MDPRDVFKKYLGYSVGFHALVLTLLLLFGRSLPPAPEPATVVTMIRLTRSTGSTASPLLKKSGEPGTVAAPPTLPPVKPPEPEKPQVAAPPPPAKPPEKVVQIPDKEKKPQKPQPVPTTPAPPQPSPQKPRPDDKKIAEALAAVKGELEQRETQAQTPPEANPGSPGTGPGGGPGSPFGSPGGTVSAADPELARYQSQVRSKIIREWVRTMAGSEGETLRARVVVRINASGNVISTNFARRSGNASFDSSALRAVERASPLPPPPPLVMAEAVQEGFVVDFSSRMLGR